MSEPAEQPPWVSALRDCVSATRGLFDAAACSCAVVTQDDLLDYVAADGAGAEEIIGVRIPTTRGIAGWAATSGQLLGVRDVRADPRFAHDIAEATHYVPTSILAAPVYAASGEVGGVLQVLDPAAAVADGWALDVLGTLAGHVGALLTTCGPTQDSDSAPPAAWSTLRERLQATGPEGERLGMAVLTEIVEHLERTHE